MISKSTFSKLILYVILIAGLSSCSSPKYLATYSTIDVNPYGAQINISLKNKKYANGELITIDSNSLILLTYNENKKLTKALTIPISDVKKIKIIYAHTPSLIGLFVVALIPVALHPGLAIFTGINILYAGLVHEMSSELYSLRLKKEFFQNTVKFARFPQGIPPGINSDSLKYPKTALPLKMKKMLRPNSFSRTK